MTNQNPATAANQRPSLKDACFTYRKETIMDTKRGRYRVLAEAPEVHTATPGDGTG